MRLLIGRRVSAISGPYLCQGFCNTHSQMLSRFYQQLRLRVRAVFGSTQMTRSRATFTRGLGH